MKNDLIHIEVAASYCAGEEPKPGASATINGMEFTVKFHDVNRETYYFLPTPTAMFKVNGKRVSRKEAYRLAA